MSDTIEPVEHPRNYEIPGWSNADAINARDATIREQDAEIERLRASRDDWMSACNRAQDHRDGANAQLTIFESENLQLRNEIARLRGLLCKCNMRTRLVGDGCEFCNPQLAEELAREQR